MRKRLASVMQRAMEWSKRLLLVVVSLLCGVGLVEGLLRVQQFLGPFVDLEFNNVGHIPSELLNHVHAPREDWCLDDRRTYGAQTGFRYTNRYDELGIRVDAGCNAPAAGGEDVRILFLGDSFIEGYDLAHSVPHLVCDALNTDPVDPRRVRMFNAGMSSYSPTIFIVQAKQLVPRLQPRLVVVDIDETDLGDDFLRYRRLARMDLTGRVVSVGSTPENRDFTRGFLEIKEAQYRLYTWRLLRRFVHSHLRAQTAEDRQAMAAIDPLAPSRDVQPGAEQRHAEAITFFEGRVDELARTLVELLGDSQRVLFVYHPHLGHLQADSTGHTWNTFVRDTVARVTSRRAIAFYDATDDLRRSFAGEPTRYYWPNDMHFNFDGLIAYSHSLLPPIMRQIERIDHGR